MLWCYFNLNELFINEGHLIFGIWVVTEHKKVNTFAGNGQFFLLKYGVLSFEILADKIRVIKLEKTIIVKI